MLFAITKLEGAVVGYEREPLLRTCWVRHLLHDDPAWFRGEDGSEGNDAVSAVMRGECVEAERSQ